jgi:hypothetical protein
MERRERHLPPFAVAGGAAILEAAAQVIGAPFKIARIARLTDAAAAFDTGLPVLDIGDAETPYSPGIRVKRARGWPCVRWRSLWTWRGMAPHQR